MVDKYAPNYGLYTLLICLIYISIAINFLILFFCVDVNTENGTHYGTLIMGLLFIILTPIRITDPRRRERGLTATVCSFALHLVITLLFAYLLDYWKIMIMYAIETFSIIIIIVISVLKNKVYKYKK